MEQTSIKNNGEVLLILLWNVLQSIKCKVQSNMKKEAALWLKGEKKEKVLRKVMTNQDSIFKRFVLMFGKTNTVFQV